MDKKQKKNDARTTARTLKLLRRELDKERRHSAALEREVATLKQELRLHQKGDHEKLSPMARRQRGVDPRTVASAKMQEAASRRAHHYRRSSYVRYLFESMMESMPIRIISKLLTYLRRLRIIQIAATVLTAVGTIALVAVVSAALIPFLIAGTVFLGVGACVLSRQTNRHLKQALDGRHLRVFFPPRGASWEPDSFFMRQARAMAAEDGVAVIIVSPYSLSRRGAGKKSFFFTARRDAEHLYVVRRHYFFMLRKRVLDIVDPDMTVIY